ncbi:mannitol 1-phosphate dehydrogenase [Fusarium albosuccineum]|uniref:Mannitol 1-phosphate dehydrogenase n=1 Tax=Fusarium albosuccineum TaxID=1237068 RepID=A0A8H4PA14_9HYPO|nr:mannitol 1-phosphate dehydrogenase [Fusarium albosuccineum]
MPSASKVAIIGGGIAGLSASVGLARLGVACHVYENGNPKEGASIGFSGRAAEALEELGLYEPILKAGRAFSSDTGASTMRDSEGKVLSAGPKRPSWPGMKDTVVIYRPMMIDVMTKAAKDLGVQVINGVTFTDIQTRVDGVTIRFTDGSQADYDLVIGADGIGSATRQAMFPDSPSTQYAGQWSIRWMAPGEHIDGESWYNSSAGRFGFYSLPGGHIYVASILDIADDERMTDDEARERFTKLLDSCTAPAVVELRSRLTEDSTLIARPFRWILVDQPWHRGRVLLVGDAAHATTAHMGMGGGMAVEDAAVLAQCVGNASTWEEVFGRFMERRFERVKTVVEGSLALSKLTQTAAPPAERMAALSKAWEAVSDPY